MKNVSDLPGLATGARWHYELYDAMTSKRAYSDVRPQPEVRAEIIRCKGTQFDPAFADIMTA